MLALPTQCSLLHDTRAWHVSYLRQVLAFSTRVHNIGCAPFVIGVPSGYTPGCFDTIGNINPDHVEGDVIRLPDGCPPMAPPPPPPLSKGRRVGDASASDDQQLPPFNPQRRPGSDGGDKQRKRLATDAWPRRLNTSNGHYSGSTKAR